MGYQRVTIARHAFFYKVFFNKHREFLDELTNIDYTTLFSGFEKLTVFYSSYSYYLREHDKDTHLKDMIKENKNIYKNDNIYEQIRLKYKIGGLGCLNYNELYNLNLNYHKYLKSILEIFEVFCYRFAPSDIFPKITASSSEYDLKLMYVVYDSFYESLFNLHAKIHTKLLKFNIVEFPEMFKILMVFFYGYSYYIQKDTIKVIKDKFNELYEYYNNKEFQEIYFNLIQGRVNANGLKVLEEYKDSMFDSCIDIFELINGDLPKSNLFPKRAEKITIDLTLI